MRILALDLGTKTGWARQDFHGPTIAMPCGEVRSGIWRLASDKELREQKKAGLTRCCDVRFRRLNTEIENQWGKAYTFPSTDWIFFEDVQFLTSQAQAQLWAGFRAVVAMWYPLIRIVGVPVGTLKKFATGKGNSDKLAMSLALYRKDHKTFEGAPEALIKQSVFVVERATQRPVDDNEVDARHLLNYALWKLNTQQVPV